MAEAAPMMIFLNGFAPVGFKSAAWVSDRRGFVFLIGVVVVEGGRLIRRGFVFVRVYGLC